MTQKEQLLRDALAAIIGLSNGEDEGIGLVAQMALDKADAMDRKVDIVDAMGRKFDICPTCKTPVIDGQCWCEIVMEGDNE